MRESPPIEVQKLRRPRRASLAGFLLFASAAWAQVGLVGSQFLTADSDGLDTEAEAGAWFGHSAASGDFDGDGFDDLAIGVPQRTVGGDASAGEVVVLYGSASGLAIAGHQVWSQDSAGIDDAAEPDDSFGWSLAAGDFNGDGYDDLAVSAPFEEIAGFEEAGGVHVLPGGVGGLTATGSLRLEQGAAGILDDAETDDRLGIALATGDFDDDGYDDLAIAAPGEDQEGMPAYADLGAVHVLFGSVAGLAATDNRFYRPGDAVITIVPPEAGIAFGGALAAGPLILSGQDQIAIGIPRLSVDGAAGAGGVVIVANPRPGGLQSGFITQSSPGVPDVAEAGDNFGATLAIGHFDGQAAAALAVGSPGEDVEAESAEDAGAVHLVVGLFTAEPVVTLWLQEDLPPLASEPGDRFGAELAVGDFDADGRDDLVIGAPTEDVNVVGGEDFGGGAILYGDAASGLTADGAQLLPLGTFLVQPDLQFGTAMAAGRFSGHSGSDFAFSAPRMSVPFKLAPPRGVPLDDAGAVAVYASIALFLDGFESGGAAEWSSAQP